MARTNEVRFSPEPVSDDFLNTAIFFSRGILMDDPYIELNAFLKCKAIVSTGGQAKTLIRSEAVLVNGVVEIRNKKKLRAGDKVTYDYKEYIVDSTVLRVSKNKIHREE